MGSLLQTCLEWGIHTLFPLSSLYLVIFCHFHPGPVQNQIFWQLGGAWLLCSSDIGDTAGVDTANKVGGLVCSLGLSPLSPAMTYLLLCLPYCGIHCNYFWLTLVGKVQHLLAHSSALPPSQCTAPSPLPLFISSLVLLVRGKGVLKPPAMIMGFFLP